MVKINKKKIKFNKGFTLLEIMVVVGLLTFIMSTIFGILASARRVWATGEALISLQQEGSLGLDKMVRELRLCRSATVGADNKTVRFNIPIDADGDGFIDLSGGTVIYGADGHQGWNIEYQIDTNNKQVMRRVLDTSNNQVSQRILAKNINPDPLLTYFQTVTGGQAVNIGLAIEIGAMEGLTLNPPLQIALSTQVNLRN